jgi:hypothetical protein
MLIYFLVLSSYAHLAFENPFQCFPYTKEFLEDSIMEYDYCQANKPNFKNYSPLLNAKLKNVQIIFRHGDRSPTASLFNEDSWDMCPHTEKVQSIHRDYTYVRKIDIPSDAKMMWKGKCNIGQLTLKGMQQSFDLGQQLRKLYILDAQFWKNNTIPDIENVRIATTDVWRTIQTVFIRLINLNRRKK